MRWLFYLSALFYGIFCLWEKPWFRSIHHCWEGYPYHKVEITNSFWLVSLYLWGIGKGGGTRNTRWQLQTLSGCWSKSDNNSGGAGRLVLLHGRTLLLLDPLNQVNPTSNSISIHSVDIIFNLGSQSLDYIIYMAYFSFHLCKFPSLKLIL